MLSHWPWFFCLACFLGFQTLSFASVATKGSHSLFSIPISSINNADGSGTCGPIVQQQHINRGVRRLAMMTGRTPPSDHVLISALFQRISHLPVDILRKYKLDDVKKKAAAYLSNSPRARGENSYDPGPPGHNIGLTIEAYDLGYMATVKIGNPPQDFQLLVDSGSADFWVGGEGCRGNDGGDCGPHKFLGPNSSTTYRSTQQKWYIGYVSGFVSGLLAQDDISIADLTVKNHTFGVAFNETKEFTPNYIPFDGLIGFAKSDISQQGVPTLLHALQQANLISAPIVSYRIPRSADGKNDGVMTIGGMDSRFFDAKTLVRQKNTNPFGFWGVAVDGIKVAQNDMQWSNRKIVLDTGTSLILAPKDDVEAIHKSIPGAKNNGSGWRVPCNLTSSIEFTIGEQAFPVDPRDIAFYPVPEDPGYCMSGIAVGGVGPFFSNNEWLVGDVFLKNVYFSTDESRDEVCIARPLP